jgi:N-acetylglucosaminyldiphosphoundecaprenol N-acetyl-beta-D-mannosaminyltransferase
MSKYYKSKTFIELPLNGLSYDETMYHLDEAIINNTQILYGDLNAFSYCLLKENESVNAFFYELDILNIDGQSVKWAYSFLYGNDIPKTSGCDLMQKVVEVAFNKNYKIYFLGASETVINQLVDIFTQKFSSQIIAGYRNGYFLPEEEEKIARQIADSGANILFVALPSPKKELFLKHYKEILKPLNFLMGVGGSFDVIAGFTKRAPIWMQDMGLEWFYRFLQEPRRMWKRYLITNSLFIYYVLREKFSGKSSK